MTLADRIRQMGDEELAEFLVWEAPDECTDPDTGGDLECFRGGCALQCPHGRRTANMLRHLQKEI